MESQFIKELYINWNNINRNSYLYNIKSLKSFKKLDLNCPITIFCGENGSGKSTLLEAIAVDLGFSPEGGTRNYYFSTYDSHSELCDNIKLIKGAKKSKWGYFLRAESFYNVATQNKEYNEEKTPYFYDFHELSHGESLLRVLSDQFSGNGIYILDEPEAALSPQRQLTLLLEIVRCAKNNSQFIMVTHSPILLAIPNAKIYCFDDGKVESCEYEDTESYKVTELLINNKEQLINNLLRD